MYTLEVLIPVYNDLPGLIKTINSIDNIDLSITVVDDGSTDSICLSNFQNFKANIKLINLKVNSGIIKALNTGLDSLIESNPKYIFRIDAGDIFCFEGIQERLNFIINEKVGIIGGGTKFIDEKSAKGFVSNRISNNPSKLFPLVTNYIHSGIIFKYTELRYNPKNKFCEDVFLFKEIEDIYGGKRVKTNYHVNVFQGVSGISTEKRTLQLSSFTESIKRNNEKINILVKTLALIKLYLTRVFLKNKSKEMLLKSILRK